MTAKTHDTQLKANPKIYQCQQIDKIWLTPTILKLRILNPDLVSFSFPGQFVNIKVSENYVPLLRRPFSIHQVNQSDGWFEILVQVIGTGTELLAATKIGDELDVLGPLGNHFSRSKEYQRAILIAGGLGIAPLLFLAQTLTRQQLATTLFYGNRSKLAFCCLDDFTNLGVPYFLATEDGSLGFKGKVSDLLLSKQELLRNSTSIIYACGPIPMLQKIKEITAQFNIPCQISLETMMACGFGVCLGCVVNSVSFVELYRYVCKEGPVFYANEIDLNV